MSEPQYEAVRRLAFTIHVGLPDQSDRRHSSINSHSAATAAARMRWPATFVWKRGANSAGSRKTAESAILPEDRDIEPESHTGFELVLQLKGPGPARAFCLSPWSELVNVHVRANIKHTVAP